MISPTMRGKIISIIGHTFVATIIAIPYLPSLALCALIMFLLTGCALGPTYVHATKGPRDYAADMSYCEAQGQQAQHPRDRYAFTKLRVQEQCMIGRGWDAKR